MEIYTWKAGFSTSQKIARGKYYQISLAEGKYEFENYILFQQPYDLAEDEDSDAEQNGIYAEVNWDSCFNKVEYVKISPTLFETLISGTIFQIDIADAKITKKFK